MAPLVESGGPDMTVLSHSFTYFLDKDELFGGPIGTVSFKCAPPLFLKYRNTNYVTNYCLELRCVCGLGVELGTSLRHPCLEGVALQCLRGRGLPRCLCG